MLYSVLTTWVGFRSEACHEDDKVEAKNWKKGERIPPTYPPPSHPQLSPHLLLFPYRVSLHSESILDHPGREGQWESAVVLEPGVFDHHLHPSEEPRLELTVVAFVPVQLDLLVRLQICQIEKKNQGCQELES